MFCGLETALSEVEMRCSSPCLLAVCLFSLSVWGVSPDEKLFPAFPGAEGAGAYTPGGRGGKVFLVTTLEDYRPGREKAIPGSLREAIEAKMPRTVLFRNGGTIDLKKELQIENPFITIAGQSAPGGGIALKRYPLEIKTHDVVVRYLRIRPGDLAGKEMDGLSCSAQRVIIDHCSVGWSIDETLSTNGDSQDVTVQWCYITESLNKSKHHKGEHGYGSLISSPGEMSYHHNLYGFHKSRNPRPGDVLLDFRNNLIVGWGIRAGYNRDNVTLMNYVGNFLEPYPYSKLADSAFFTESVPPDARMRIYLADNIHKGTTAGTADNWLLVTPPSGKTREQIEFLKTAKPLATSTVTTDTAEEAREKILKTGGASLPLRDAVDERITKQVTMHTGGLINSPDDVGGWPELVAGTPPTDANKDGLPDEWVAKYTLKTGENVPQADPDKDGYTNLEEFLNGTNPTQAEKWIAPPAAKVPEGLDFLNPQDVVLSTSTAGGEIRYTLDGSEPTMSSTAYRGPVTIDRTCVLRARTFLAGEGSHVRNVRLNRLLPLEPVSAGGHTPGLAYEYFEHPKWSGEGWEELKALRTGVHPELNLDPRNGREEKFGLRFRGFLRVPREGLYTFSLRCSARGELRIGEKSDWLLESQSFRRENSKALALKAGDHPLEFRIFFNGNAEKRVEIQWEGAGVSKQQIPASALFH
ncbi:MAG: chitobiase/beta-hexosaminidase C-terminal domain-containing protein [Planctomycetales bacterium]